MALRSLAARWRTLGYSSAPGLTRAASSAPSVYDKLVDITVIDREGRRHSLRGLEGQTLVELLQAHTDTLGEDVLAASPEGRGAAEAHVKVPNELLERVPPPGGDDARSLREVADEFDTDKHSRLASKIVLDRNMMGVTIALGKLYPWKSL